LIDRVVIVKDRASKAYELSDILDAIQSAGPLFAISSISDEEQGAICFLSALVTFYISHLLLKKWWRM